MRQRAATVVPIIGARKASQLKDNLGSVNVTLTQAQQNRLDRVSAIERGFPYHFITGGRDSFMGPVTHLVDDHRNTVV